MSTQSPFRSNIKFIRPVQEIQKIYYTTQIKTIIYKACTKKTNQIIVTTNISLQIACKQTKKNGKSKIIK